METIVYILIALILVLLALVCWQYHYLRRFEAFGDRVSRRCKYTVKQIQELTSLNQKLLEKLDDPTVETLYLLAPHVGHAPTEAWILHPSRAEPIDPADVDMDSTPTDEDNTLLADMGIDKTTVNTMF